MSQRSGSRGGRVSQAQQQQMAQQMAQQEAALRTLGVNLVANGVRSPRVQDATLGKAVSATVAVGPDLMDGRILGDGTFANAGMFNTKELVLMTPEWARIFTQELNNSRGVVAQAAAQGILDFSLGLYGVLPDGGEGYYLPGITQYFPDDRARISISGVTTETGQLNPGVPAFALPGSTQARIINNVHGFAVGLAFVRNPEKQTGYLRAGSKGWRDSFARWANGRSSAGAPDVAHLFGQGGVYGLGPIYNAYQIDIGVVADQRGTDFPVRFRVLGNRSLQDLTNDSQFMREVAAYYDAYLKNPDQRKLGQYGAASLELRHANKMTLGASGSQAGDVNEFNQAIINAFANTGSVRGVAKWGKDRNGRNYTNSSERLGLTAFPLRDAAGNPLPQEQLVNGAAGFCNVAGYGPGVTQRASAFGEYGIRATKRGKQHRSNAKGMQGAQVGPTTYSCAPTQDFVVNTRRRVYQAGGDRALPNMSLAQAIDARGVPGLTSQGLQALHDDWVVNPGAYGTNPNYMLADGRGFSRAAPAINAQLLSPEQQAQYAGLDLTYGQKAARSDQLAALIEGRTTNVTAPKTSYPTGRPTARRGSQRTAQ